MTSDITSGKQSLEGTPDEIKRNAAEQTCCVLEFEAKLNVSFSMIK